MSRSKLDERGRPSIMLYYLKDGNGYIVWDRTLSKTVKTTHVKFREDVFPGPLTLKVPVEEPALLPWPESDD